MEMPIHGEMLLAAAPARNCFEDLVPSAETCWEKIKDAKTKPNFRKLNLRKQIVCTQPLSQFLF